MDIARIESMTQNPLTAAQKDRKRAEKTAAEFEQMFVRTMVSSLRSTASIGGDDMFGKGPGSDTFADWFDQNLAEQVSSTSDVGIAKSLLQDLERHHEIPADAQQKARAAADRNSFLAAKTMAKGGFDVVL